MLGMRSPWSRWSAVATALGLAALLAASCATPRDPPSAGPAVPLRADTGAAISPENASDVRTARPATDLVPAAGPVPVGVSATSAPPSRAGDPDVRHGTLDGRSWTLVTTRRDASLCLRLGWDDVPEQWEVCYSTDYAELPLAWTNPTPPSGSHRPVMFAVGLAPRAAAGVQVVRGDVVVGEGEAFLGDLVADHAGFAVPFAIEGRDTLDPVVDLPGDGLRAGLLLPLEVVALDSSDEELVRGGPTVGSPGPLVCLDTGSAVVEFDGACFPTGDPRTVQSNDGRLLLVPAVQGAASVDLVFDGVIVDSHATAVLRLPDGSGGAVVTLAAFRPAPEQRWASFVLDSRGAGGVLLGSTSMLRGDGDGEMPDTL